jgi:hypothetical protein
MNFIKNDSEGVKRGPVHIIASTSLSLLICEWFRKDHCCVRP